MSDWFVDSLCAIVSLTDSFLFLSVGVNTGGLLHCCNLVDAVFQVY